MHRSMLFVVALVSLCQAVAAEEGEWARFRGPDGSGISSAKGIPVTWTDADYRWKIKLPGTGHSSPVVWRKRVYVTAGDAGTAQRLVVCVEAATGTILWTRSYASRPYPQHPDNAYASATPAADERGLVVTWTTPQQVTLLALDHDGGEVWKRELGPRVAVFGSGASPVIVGDLVILNNDQDDPKSNPTAYAKAAAQEAGSGCIIAVDRQTGRTRWQTPRTADLCSYGTPVVQRGDDGRALVVAASRAHGVFALNAADGRVAWAAPALFKGRSVASPILVDGLVVATCGSGLTGLRCVAVRPGSADGSRPPAVVLDIARSVPMVPTPLAKNGLLYLWSDTGVVSCIRLATAETLWRERVEGAYYSSPIWIDGRLYCPTRTGQMTVIAAGEQFAVLARVPLGEKCYATPAVADGVLYIRTVSALMALGAAKQS